MDDRRETTKEALKTIDRGGKGANVGAMGWLELGRGNLSHGRRQSKRATDLLGNLRFGRRKFAERMQISHGLIGQTQVSVGFVGQFLKLPAGQMQIFDGFVGQMQVSDGFVARFVG